jgi:soluble lytic murein transglycosylase
VNALGLMQIMPATGEWMAAQMDIPWRGPQTLFDPIVNVRIGIAYLRHLADRYDGDIGTALVAYNWGPGRIDRRLRRGVELPKEYAQLVLEAYGETATRS